VVLLCTRIPAPALPDVIGENMVLQRDMAVPIWGTTDPADSVTVRVEPCPAAGDGLQVKTTIADSNGQWRVSLDPMRAGLNARRMTIRSAAGLVTFTNVLVGEVWLAAGQSNMEQPLRRCEGGRVAAVDHPALRLFHMPRQTSGDAVGEKIGSWQVCAPENAARFSGLAFFFGRELQQHLDVPVGLICSAAGGTAIHQWLPPGSGATDPAHSRLYNSMVRPLVPFGIRGVIWYQGEADVGRAEAYKGLFPALITGWRGAWRKGDSAAGQAFPFLFVQLANYTTPRDDPVMTSHWAELREAQAAALAVTNTGMAVAIDLGEADSIHPRNKQDVAQRLVLAARAVAYGETCVHSGPVHRSTRIRGDRIMLGFDHIGGGLLARDGPLQRFEIADAKGRYHNAEATIEGDVVTVRQRGIPRPQAVRYAWAENPRGCNLVNREGLPAVPFRTTATLKRPLPRTTHRYRCRRAPSTPPTAAYWRQFPAAGPFRHLQSYDRPTYPTGVKLAYDDTHLYALFACREPAMAGLVAEVDRHDGPVYEDDSVELFIDTDLDGETYHQVVVNSAGVVFDSRNKGGVAWNSGADVTIGADAAGWTALLALPWAALGASPPRAGVEMGLQLARTRAQKPRESSQWAPSYSPGNHRPSHFGLLIFE